MKDKTMRNSSKMITTCEVLRELNDMFQEDSEFHIEVRQKLLKAQLLAIKMRNKLKEFDKKVFNNFWDEENINVDEKIQKRINPEYKTGNIE